MTAFATSTLPLKQGRSDQRFASLGGISKTARYRGLPEKFAELILRHRRLLYLQLTENSQELFRPFVRRNSCVAVHHSNLNFFERCFLITHTGSRCSDLTSVRTLWPSRLPSRQLTTQVVQLLRVICRCHENSRKRVNKIPLP